MRFEQVRTVLQKHAPDYHRQVSSFYQRMAEGDVSPRVRLMLDYLIDHEQSRALALGEFCQGAPQQLLDQWLKGVESHFPQADISLIEEGAETDLDLVVKSAALYKKTLIDYFIHLLEQCNDRKIRNLFQTWKDQEEKAMKRMIRHAQGLADL
jgi:rubrerythrin